MDPGASDVSVEPDLGAAVFEAGESRVGDEGSFVKGVGVAIGVEGPAITEVGGVANLDLAGDSEQEAAVFAGQEEVFAVVPGGHPAFGERGAGVGIGQDLLDESLDFL